MIKQILQMNPAPYHGLIIDIVSYGDYSALRIYSDNFEQFSEPQKSSLLEWLHEQLVAVNAVTPCTLEKKAYAPK